MTRSLAALGYRRATALADTPLAPAGATLRGHEFHYSRWDYDDTPPKPAWLLRGNRDSDPVIRAGHAEGGLLASYVHLPLAQRPKLAVRFVDRMRDYANRQPREPSLLPPVNQLAQQEAL